MDLSADERRDAMVDSVVDTTWPGAEAFLEEEWTSVVNSSDSMLASFVAESWERTSLMETNKLLSNQVEVLAALAGRPCSGIATRRAVQLQCASRRLAGVRVLGTSRAAAVRLQRVSRGRALRSSLTSWHAAATRIQAQLRASVATRLARAVARDRAATRIQRATRAYLTDLASGSTKTWLRRELMIARQQTRQAASALERHNATLDRVVTAHSAAASRARLAEAQVAEAASSHTRELQQLCDSFEARQSAMEARHEHDKRALLDEISELLAQVASFGVENSKLQEQASELLVEKLQGWI